MKLLKLWTLFFVQLSGNILEMILQSLYILLFLCLHLSNSWTQWMPGEPNLAEELCTEVYRDSGHVMADASCDWERKPLCKKPVTSGIVQ